MKAFVYHRPGERGWGTVPEPSIIDPTAVVVRIDTSTICGTDLRILNGDVPETTSGTILGHEAVGTVQEVGASVTTVAPGDPGWIFDHLIDRPQAEHAHVPFGDNSVYEIGAELSDEQVLFVADILSTSLEVGVLNGVVSPGDVVAIIGAGPIGLAAILTARLYSPGRIVAIDLADSRLEAARQFGADVTINSGSLDPVEEIMNMTDGLGADVALEAVGVPETFELSAALIKPGGHVASIGVHGNPAALQLEQLWIPT